jgi:hypothetical protein
MSVSAKNGLMKRPSQKAKSRESGQSVGFLAFSANLRQGREGDFPLIMRPLTEEETTTFFKKLAKYIGRNIRHLIDRKDGNYCFRLHKDRVYYASEDLVTFFASSSLKNND